MFAFSLSFARQITRSILQGRIKQNYGNDLIGKPCIKITSTNLLQHTYYFNIFCKIKYSYLYYKPSPKVIDLVSFMYQKYSKCLTIYGHGGHCKVGLGQPRIIICENLVEPTFPMLYTMSKTHWYIDFRDDFKWCLPCMGVVAILVM